jgi:hypothetical protein
MVCSTSSGERFQRHEQIRDQGAVFVLRDDVKLRVECRLFKAQLCQGLVRIGSHLTNTKAWPLRAMLAFDPKPTATRSKQVRPMFVVSHRGSTHDCWQRRERLRVLDRCTVLCWNQPNGDRLGPQRLAIVVAEFLAKQSGLHDHSLDALAGQDFATILRLTRRRQRVLAR